MIDVNTARAVAQPLQALAEPTRMFLFELLVEQPRTVSELAELLGEELVNVSHHLGVMKRFGLVDSERQGRTKVYSLLDPPFTAGKGTAKPTVVLGTWKLVFQGGYLKPRPPKPKKK
jgi:ArsR family transcriptional regulator, nickel/cobalt-responsive transcriptional repressor